MPIFKVFKLTGCKPHCKQTHYNLMVSEIQERTESPPMMPDSLLDSSGPLDMLYFYVPSPMVTVKEEFKVYDLLDWAADCGGMGGILLGLSLAAGFERVLQLIKRIKKKPCWN